MDALQLFSERYQGFQEYPERLLNGLSEQQLRELPHPKLNSIAWILWHIARCEDVGVNRLLCDESQVFDDGAWSHRLCVSERQVGTGMTRREVEELSNVIDLTELDAYRLAIAERTAGTVADLPLQHLKQELSVEQLKRVFVDEGAGGPAAEKIVEAYSGQTKGWLLGHIALTHSFYHIGQAFSIRSMLGVENVW